jgi:hypothetical protein
MIIILRKMLTQSLSLNELSRVKTILKFAITVYIKSGHLDELSIPIKILMRKKK